MYGEVENYCEVKNIIFIRETTELKYTHMYYMRSTYMIFNTVRCCIWWNIRVTISKTVKSQPYDTTTEFIIHKYGIVCIIHCRVKLGQATESYGLYE